MKTLLKFLLPVLVLIIAALGARVLIRSRKKIKPKIVETKPPLVDTVTVQRETHAFSVKALGTVIPAQSMTVQAELSARIVELHPNLIQGGLIKAGEVLIKLDPRDFELAVKDQEAQVARAELELAQELGRQRIAEREWAIVSKSKSKNGQGITDLARRIPHIKNAKAAIAAAKSALERAQINLSRTVIPCPFNAIVRSEAVELGQLVTPQSQLATLVGTDFFYVQASLPMRDLTVISLPNNQGQGGSKAVVTQAFGPEKTLTKSGQVVRLLGDLDTVGRLARVLIEVKDPLNKNGGEVKRPLLLGSFVSLEISGPQVKEVIRVPRKAMRANDTVWIVDSKATLSIRSVQSVWRDSDWVFVNTGLSQGDSVITNRIETAVEGMKVRTEAQEIKMTAPSKMTRSGMKEG